MRRPLYALLRDLALVLALGAAVVLGTFLVWLNAQAARSGQR